jgi:hypothetical protein
MMKKDELAGMVVYCIRGARNWRTVTGSCVGD